MKFKENIDKAKYLQEHYPFADLPKLTDKKYCIHCFSEIVVGDYKIEIANKEEYIVCPNAPRCDGTVIDWFPIEKRLS